MKETINERWHNIYRQYESNRNVRQQAKMENKAGYWVFKNQKKKERQTGKIDLVYKNIEVVV